VPNLIPNLVSVTQASAQQEKAFSHLAGAIPSVLFASTNPPTKSRCYRQNESAIARSSQSAATNPQLQSSQLFINLQYEMVGTENRLAVERMRYNQAVQAYNQQVQAFPTSLLAKAWGFHQQSFFQATK
jgi:LemA protein